MSDDFNKLEVLIKIMKMTSAEESVALVALRKANSLLSSEGWDWDRLLRGKVRVVADPFAGASRTSAPAPQASPATMRAPKPAYQPPPPPPRPAPNPWPQGQKPAAPPPRPAQPAYSPPPPPKQAPPGPLHFRRSSTGEWCIASYMRADQLVTQKVTLTKKDGSTSSEICGPFLEQDHSGHYLYKIAKATKWKSRFADQSGIGDII